MGKTIQDIIGAKIESFNKVYDYWQFVTDKGTINIYNFFMFLTSQGENYDMKDVNESDLINSTVSNVDFEIGKHLKLEINHDKLIDIYLEEEACKGPEAVSIYYNSGEIIIFD